MATRTVARLVGPKRWLPARGGADVVLVLFWGLDAPVVALEPRLHRLAASMVAVMLVFHHSESTRSSASGFEPRHGR